MIFAFPKTFTIFYLSIYYFKAKVRLILTLIMVILGNAEIADWVLSNALANIREFNPQNVLREAPKNCFARPKLVMIMVKEHAW